MSILAARGRPERGKVRGGTGPAMSGQPVRIAEMGGSLVVTYGGAPHQVPLERAVGPRRSPATQASPAMIVASGLDIVPFVDHAGVLADLVRWCHNPDPVAVRVLTGPGGAGKTRTGLRLCQEMEGRNWLAGFLAADAGTDALHELARVPVDVLVVVDEAANRGAQLALLLSLLAQRSDSRHATRVLLAHRDHPDRPRRLDSLRGASELLDAWLAAAPVDQLAQCPPDPAARRHLYLGAHRSFVAQLSLPAGSAEAPAALDGAVFTNPQMIVIAAYLGASGAPLADTAPDLLESLIDDHEDRYWNWMAGRQDPPLRAGKALRRQLAALAALAGADDQAEAERLVTLIDDSVLGGPQDPRSLARWASTLYPGPRFWNGLLPNVLSEYLVASTFSEDQVLLAGVLGGAPRSRPMDSLSQPMTLLARAVVGRPALGISVSAALGQQLGYLCRQVAAGSGGASGGASGGGSGGAGSGRAAEGATAAVGGSSTVAAALTELVRVCPPDTTTLPPILDDLPPRPAQALRPLAAMLTQQTEAFYRRLAEEEPNVYLPNLAVALNNLSVRLADLGRLDEAAGLIQEAVGYYRRLANEDPTGFRSHLAVSLYNLSLRLTDLGRAHEAAAAIADSVAQYRALASADAAAFQANVASALYNLSLRLFELGRIDEAAAAIAEAAVHYKELAGADPATYRPKLAPVLADLSGRLAELGRTEKAAATMADAVGQYRELVVVNPDRYRPKLAAALRELGRRLAEFGRHQKALAATTEAAEQYRRVVSVDPTQLPNLVGALEDLAQRLADVGRRKEAAAKREEAVAVLKQAWPPSGGRR